MPSMSDAAQQILENLAQVRQRIELAADRAGRRAVDIGLVAVTKYVDATVTAALLSAGCVALGESRPQQLWEKAAQPELANASWHMIGHLQRNKVQRTLPLVDLIHSVDSQRLLKTINDAAQQRDRRVRVLLEINCSGETEKQGLTEEGLQAVLPLLPAFENVEVCGLMTMASRTGGEATAGRNFSALRELRDRVTPTCPPEVRLTELSMGMSHDFEVAIREGATLVRIGSLLFQGVKKA